MKHRFLVILCVIYSLMVIAVVTRNGGLLLLAIPFLTYLGTAILQLPGEVRLQASRSFNNANPFATTPVEVNVSLENTGPERGGAGTDFFGVREFRTGDPINQIHWRLTARHPQSFFTKELEREEIADIGLILDARTITELSNGKETLFEHSIKATASLAKVFLREGNRVGMLIFGSGITCVFPGGGKQQLQIIFQNLTRATTGSNASLNLFTYLPVRMFPSRSYIIVISPVELRDLSAFKRLRAFGYHVLLVSPDPVSYGVESARSEREYLLAARAARLERQILLSQLKQLGIDVVDWQVDQPLSKIIHAALRKRKTRW